MRQAALRWRLMGACTTLALVPLVSHAQAAAPAAAAPASESASAVPVPRTLTPEDMAKLRRSVQNSKARSLEEARQAELQQQEAARQAEALRRQLEAQAAWQAEEDARAEAEMEAERAQKAAQWNAWKSANERALADSLGRLNDTVSRAQAQQAQQRARQQELADERERAERQRQVQLINQATQRQNDEAARLATQRQASDQRRSEAQASEQAQTQRRQAEFQQQVLAERARLAAQQPQAAAVPKGGSAATDDIQRQMFPEAIIVCTHPRGPKGAFECQSPVTSYSGHTENISGYQTPEQTVASLSASCPSPRRLSSSTHLVWGCGFAATNNSNSMDRGAGVDVQGRSSYFCSPKETSCRRTSP